MASNKHSIETVPTHIITGFLGVGKTSTLLHFLKSKPESERWAILVNEFGEIGVDGSLFEGRQGAKQGEKHGVFIREVPGGCMCCAAGVSMQVALNQLLSRAKPDRLLIEPTGLGHPREVLRVLSSEHYQGVLDVQKILTLVDARKLSDERYTQHQTFNQQIAIADIIVGNKQDLYREGDGDALKNYVAQVGKVDAQVVFAQNGAVAFAYLQGGTAATEYAHHLHSEGHRPHDKGLLAEVPIPECGYVKATNKGEGFCSVGWRFSTNRVFQYAALYRFLDGLLVERMKAVFVTDRGVFGFNVTPDGLSEVEMVAGVESRVEIITNAVCEDWEAQLMDCLMPDGSGCE